MINNFDQLWEEFLNDVNGEELVEDEYSGNDYV